MAEATLAGLDRLNALPHEDAVAALAQCCAVRAWAEAVAAGRPYADADALYTTADRVWQELGEAAWREAFRGHPRIGERSAATPGGTVARNWSAQEQSGMRAADDAVRMELARAQREYEARFGHIFLICATGLTATDMLAAVRTRMHNDPGTELRVVAEEQRRITRLRLEKLLS